MAESTVTFKVLGMTCSTCALTIEKQLSDQPGVIRANANFALAQATVTFDPAKITPKQLVQAMRDVGYDVDIERAELDIAGIVCASCIIAIENALKDIQGIIDANVNPVTAKAVIDYDPSVLALDTIVQTIRATGYDVVEIPSVEAEEIGFDREKALRHREIRTYRNQFIFTIIFGIPILFGMLAPYVPVIPPLFMDPVFQFAMTTPVMIVVGYGFTEEHSSQSRTEPQTWTSLFPWVRLRPLRTAPLQPL